jgi:hypothetical protein
MWKRRDYEGGGWFLLWFSYADRESCHTNVRKII